MELERIINRLTTEVRRVVLMVEGHLGASHEPLSEDAAAARQREHGSVHIGGGLWQLFTLAEDESGQLFVRVESAHIRSHNKWCSAIYAAQRCNAWLATELGSETARIMSESPVSADNPVHALRRPKYIAPDRQRCSCGERFVGKRDGDDLVLSSQHEALRVSLASGPLNYNVELAGHSVVIMADETTTAAGVAIAACKKGGAPC